jgi:hypothetical protein
MLPSDTVAAVLPVVTAFECLEVPYYISGSFASSAHGLPRATLDVDADLAPEHVAPLVEALQGGYYVSRPAVSDAIARRSCFNVIHLATSMKVDVFAVKDRDYDRVALTRIQRNPVYQDDQDDPPRQLCFASAEDVILSKLESYRLADEASDVQWRDVIGVLKVQGDRLDREYLARWAEELKVADLLQRAWQQVEG